MATNRYIGARYVPIFAGDWDNTIAYDPLTIVSYQGDSYTSKGYVPTGVAITNESYWVKTGNFNQQLANLDDRVESAENEIQELWLRPVGLVRSKKFYITDAIGENPPTPVTIGQGSYLRIHFTSDGTESDFDDFVRYGENQLSTNCFISGRIVSDSTALPVYQVNVIGTHYGRNDPETGKGRIYMTLYNAGEECEITGGYILMYYYDPRMSPVGV